MTPPMAAPAAASCTTSANQLCWNGFEAVTPPLLHHKNKVQWQPGFHWGGEDGRRGIGSSTQLTNQRYGQQQGRQPHSRQSNTTSTDRGQRREDTTGRGNPAPMTAKPFKNQNLRGQTLLFRCLETGFVTTAPALSRYQQGRGIDPTLRELVDSVPPTGSGKSPQAPVITLERSSRATSGH